jgi:hypothetical protein
VRGLAEADQRDARVLRAQAGDGWRNRRATNVEWFRNHCRDPWDRAGDEMLERRDGVHVLEDGSAPHGILQSRSLEPSEDECGNARLQTCALCFSGGGLAGASVREEVAGSHRAQG